MRRILTVIAAVGFAALFAFMLSQVVLAEDSSAKTDASAKADDSAKTDASSKADAPADRIVVMYFHRTKRCPTCLKMGGYTEEAISSGFAEQIKSGKVEFHFIDFQDKKNEKLTKGYQVSGPTLIVTKVVDNKVEEQKNLKEMWTKVRDKAAFIEYVQSNVKEFLEK